MVVWNTAVGISASVLLHVSVISLFLRPHAVSEHALADGLQVSVQDSRPALGDFPEKSPEHRAARPEKQIQTEMSLAQTATTSATVGSVELFSKPNTGRAAQGSLAEGAGIHANYPRISRILGEEGNVVVEIRRDELAHVIGAAVLHTSGYPRLDESAVNAIRTAIATGQDLSVLGGKTTFIFKLHE